MPSLETLLLVFSFVWGAIWGSFLNVVIHRLPRGESVLTPASHCPACRQPIRWYQNIPIISYLALGGRCASCKEPISPRYPLVELVTATISMAVWNLTAFNPFVPSVPMALVIYLFLFLFALGLIAITFIDIDGMIIPDVISLPLIVIGIVFNAVLSMNFELTVLDSAIGAAAGGAVIASVILGYYLVTRREGMGWGDAKLLAAIGAWLGWKCLPFVLLASSLQGLLYAILAFLLVRGKSEQEGTHEGVQDATKEDDTSFRKAKLPFGPFLVLAALEWLFFSTWLQELMGSIFRL
jgi:leader peptidase (prepilin peptidase)/N-methyltransferase